MQKSITFSLLLMFMFLGINRSHCQGSIILTYNEGDIATSLSDFDESCNGPLTTLKYTLPAGENIDITGFDVNYDFQAVGANRPLQQRSAIFCQNSNLAESTQVGSVGTPGASQSYSRTGVNIANGTYAGGTEIIFEMRAWRWIGGTGCTTTEQFIPNGSWTIKLYFNTPYDTPRAGINTNSPEAVFDVNGKLKVGDDNASIVAGNIRFNTEVQDFEGYNGLEWKSFTGANRSIAGAEKEIGADDLEVIPNPNPVFANFGSRSDQIFIDGSSMVASNSRRVYLFNYIYEEWTLMDSVNLGNLYLESFEFQKLIVRSRDTIVPAEYFFSTYNTSSGTLDLLSTEALFIPGPVRSIEFKENRCYIGEYQAFSPRIGEVNIYNTTTSPWTLMQTLTPPVTTVTNDNFGESIHQYKDKLYVGASQSGTLGFEDVGAGVVYVYEENAGSWTLVETITSPNPADNWRFGSRISSSENEIFIGSNPSSTPTNGSIAVYDINANDHGFKYELESPNLNGGYANRFDFEGDFLIVGTDRVYSDSVYAFIYKRGTPWTLLHEIKIEDEAPATLSTNVGISNTQVFWSIADSNHPAEHGIYYFNRSDANPISFADLTNIPPGFSDGDDVDDADNNPSNEIQTISKSGNTITLSNGGGTFTDFDDDPKNEEITSMTIAGSTLSIDESGNIKSVDLSPIATQWTKDGADIYFDNRVGIGISNPQESLDIDGTLQITKNSSSGNPHLNIVEDGADFIRLYMENNTGNRAVIAANPKTDTDESIINFFLDGAGDVMTIRGNDRVGINTSSPDATFHVKHDIGVDRGLILENTASDWWRFYVSSSSSNLQLFNPSNSAARGTFNYTSGAYSSASDRRLKMDISDLHFSWEKFMQIKPANYTFKSDASQRKQLGLIAQDFLPIYPELVHYNKEEDTYKLDYSGTGVVAIKAIQELYVKNENLQRENELAKKDQLKLKRENESMQNLLQDLLQRVEAMEAEMKN